MIHGLKLPAITRERLMDIVLLQIDLLYYAASYNEAKKETCISYFREKPLEERFKGRGEAIAAWLWDPHTTIRHKYLERFALLSREKHQDKLAWCLRLRKEVCDFARMHTDPMKTSVVISDFFDDEQSSSCKKPESIPTWKGAAACFFLYFYEEFLSGENPFPSRLFPGDDRADFGRRQLLDAFFAEEANQGLEVCPACDVSNYFMRGQKATHTSLDHYLPKSRYPHFSCHPYNLIPVCYFCNSSVKGEKDPLLDEHNQRRPLYRSALPYGAIGLSSSTYLDVKVKEPGKPVTIGALHPRPEESGLAGGELQKAIEIIASVYDIPGRWQRASSTISETLFRRIRQFLGNSSMVAAALPTGFDVPNEVNTLLEQLLFYLSNKDEDLRKDPYAFAMTWILVALINEHVQPAIEAQKDRQTNIDRDAPSYDPSLLEEFVSWFGQDLEENDKRAREARKLLRVPRRGS
jgi:hypothetical protein